MTGYIYWCDVMITYVMCTVQSHTNKFGDVEIAFIVNKKAFDMVKPLPSAKEKQKSHPPALGPLYTGYLLLRLRLNGYH